MYQVPFAEQIRHEVGHPGDGGRRRSRAPTTCNTILAAGRADLCALARPHLLDPYLTLRAAVAYGSRSTRGPAVPAGAAGAEEAAAYISYVTPSVTSTSSSSRPPGGSIT